MRLQKQATFDISKCQYRAHVTFSLFDILTGEEIKADKIYANDIEINSRPTERDGRYYYEFEVDSSRLLQLKITKEFKHIFIGDIRLQGEVIQGVIRVDIGRIGLLTESKNDIFFMTWGEKPVDLDIGLICDDGSVIRTEED